MNFQNGSVVSKVIDHQSSKVLRTTCYLIFQNEFSMFDTVTNITLNDRRSVRFSQSMTVKIA